LAKLGAIRGPICLPVGVARRDKVGLYGRWRFEEPPAWIVGRQAGAIAGWSQRKNQAGEQYEKYDSVPVDGDLLIVRSQLYIRLNKKCDRSATPLACSVPCPVQAAMALALRSSVKLDGCP